MYFVNENPWAKHGFLFLLSGLEFFLFEAPAVVMGSRVKFWKVPGSVFFLGLGRSGIPGERKISGTFYTSTQSDFLFFPFFFVSGLDYIGGEGSDNPRKFASAPGMTHPGALTAPVNPFISDCLCVPNPALSILGGKRNVCLKLLVWGG